ncbi:hypothetical protein T265_07398 [Opisthorchis viverrini]|uniref:Uncharacterized protein n=1 Tax=Opisthorchis viverrini TaxID=6198 RepID=A0A074ZHC9_OPIVI|nr:hypothetical protein T265_07398 [Opisthorchis viverrini]KER25112.1 hypothetical protein T265_07398 [Opisthorchis viverrini]
MNTRQVHEKFPEEGDYREGEQVKGSEWLRDGRQGDDITGEEGVEVSLLCGHHGYEFCKQEVINGRVISAF